MNFRLHRSQLTSQSAALIAIALLLSTPWAFAGKKPGGGGTGGGTTAPKPPTPTNFRVTALTAYTISIAWDPAPATLIDFNYYLSGAYHVTPAVLPKTATTHTFTALAPGQDYWLFNYTKDTAGNVGGQANVGPVRLPRDTTPPWTAPVVTVGEVGANYAHISWTRAADDGPYHYSHEVWLNGALLYKSSYPRDAIATVLRNLLPATQYTVQVRTYDLGQNPSPISDPVTFTTLPVNPNDTAAPTIPSNIFVDSWGDLEMQLIWTQSTDNFDAQANIRYDIFVNGRLEDYVFGSGGPRVAYGEPGDNLIEIFATDTSGNRSPAGTITRTLP